MRLVIGKAKFFCPQTNGKLKKQKNLKRMLPDQKPRLSGGTGHIQGARKAAGCRAR
jgi:hypothetical protein